MNLSRRNLLTLTHEYAWLLGGFTYLWARYLGEPMTVVADQEMELPAGFEFMRVAPFAEGVWPWEHWYTHGLRETLREIGEPVVTLWLPDAWIGSRRVPDGALDDLTDYVLARPNLLRLNLARADGAADLCTPVEEWRGFQVLAPGKNNPHVGSLGGMAIGAALWRRELLMRVLETGWSPWLLETEGTQRMWVKHPEMESLIVEPAPVVRLDVLSRTRPGTVNLHGLSEEDREAVREWIPSAYRILEN